MGKLQRLAFRRLCGMSLRTGYFAWQHRQFRTFWWAVRLQMRDAFWALTTGRENARALASAWGGQPIFDGLGGAPYGPHKDAGLYCVECLSSVKSGYYQEHEGRCWYCEHIKQHASPRVWKHFASLYQERY